MPLIGLEGGYPFPGARAKWQDPIPDNYFDPLVWSLIASYSGMAFRMIVPGVDLVGAGCQVGDVLFVTASNEGPTWPNTIQGFVGPDEFVCGVAEPTTLTGVHVKISPGLHHTLQSLARVIDARGLFPYTFHWSTLWTNEHQKQFRDDEKGDIYCIDPPAGGRLEGLTQKWNNDNPASIEPNPWDLMNPRPET